VNWVGPLDWEALDSQRTFRSPGQWIEGDFHEGLAVAQCGETEFLHGENEDEFDLGEQVRWFAHCDLEGRWAYKERFIGAERFSEGLAAVRCAETKKWGYIDRQGKWRIPPRFSEAVPFRNGVARVRVPTDGGGPEVRYIWRNGDWVPDRNIEIVSRQYDGLFACGRGFARLADDRLLSLVDSVGESIIRNAYEMAQGFSEGLAFVIPKGQSKWALIDVNGKELVSSQFEQVEEYKGGCAKVRLLGAWGVIGSNGEWLVPAKFEAVFRRF
jgi:hypothetical protein